MMATVSTQAPFGGREETSFGIHFSVTFMQVSSLKSASHEFISFNTFKTGMC